MSHKEHSPKTPSPRTGIFALLGGLLGVQGTSASKSSLMKGSGAFKIRLWLVLSVLGTPLARLRSRSASRSLLSRRAAFTTALAMTLVACIGGLGATSSAFAAEECSSCKPWFHLTAAARPATIAPNFGHDAVEELKVAGSGEVLVEGKQKKLGVFPWNATPGQVQTALEGVFGVGGGGNVAVTGGPTVFGTGTLSAATGTGGLTEGSEEVKEANAFAGTFAKGQEISGPGIEPGTTITNIVGSTLTLSAKATATQGAAVGKGTLVKESSEVTDVEPSGGAFAAGQEISGPGIPAGTTITEVEPGGVAGTLTLSAPATSAGSHVALHAGAALQAGSKEITAATGLFKAKEEISGPGIPLGTTIEKYELGTITLSAPATAAGTVPLAVLAPYSVTFQGALSEDSELITNPGLSKEACDQKPSLGACLTGEASAKVTTAPAPDGILVLTAVNAGDATTSGAITVSDTLPAGVTPLEEGGGPAVEFFAFGDNVGGDPLKGLCVLTGSVVSCTLPENEYPLAPYEDVEMRIGVRVGTQPAEQQVAEVSGGGAALAKIARPVPVGTGAVPFAIEQFAMTPEEADGSLDARAGSHPFQLSTTLAFNQTSNSAAPPAMPKDLHFQLPAGVVGNATAVPRCSEEDFHKLLNFQNFCPADTAVGVASVTFEEPVHVARGVTYPLPLFNLTPAPGEPARFGFTVIHTPVILDTSVRTGGDYGVTVSVSNISQAVNFISTTTTFWGVPSDPRHDASRGSACIANGVFNVLKEACEESFQPSLTPFLTMPTSCTTPFKPSVEGDSWPLKAGPSSEPASLVLQDAHTDLQDEFGRELGITGCNDVSFEPFLQAAPDVQDGSTASGLTVHVRVPQEVNQNGSGLASSSVKDITVELPEGMTLNPAGAGGLESCSEGQAGFEAGHGLNGTGFEEFAPSGEPGSLTPLFTPGLPERLSPGLNLGALGFCPNTSKVGTAKIVSPLIANPVEGSVYLATQNQNPFGSLVAMYIVAEDPISGTIVKLPGRLYLCKAAGEVLAGETCGVPGQIVSTFQNEPQLPFEDAELHFFGGERAPLSTPAFCRDNTPEHPGDYTTNASFAPWSGSTPVTSQSHFEIKHGPNGGPCPGAQLPFSPSLTGGATNLNAGAFSPLTATFGREDGEQNVTGATLHLPPGLSGILSSVKLCPEAQANAGSCGPESLVGEATVSAGVGNTPVFVKGGKIYITETYHGAPFGLSIVDPVKTGPFDLEHDTANPAEDMPACDCIVVRGKIEIDPYTTALTITTNSQAEGDNIPHMIDGIPVELKRINAITTRPGFQFNPTNCSPMKLTGLISGEEGGTDNLEVPFQVTNCKNLSFTPKFAVSTNAKTSKADGASLTAKVSEPAGAFGTQANLTKVKVELPRDLPSRLTTLQKACTSKQFESNPAGCPKESDIGHALVHTPLLPVPLEGPAIFVSHGGEAFPSLTMVLKGAPPYDITIDLVGTTFISKSGVTSTTFKTVPDQPFSSFTLTLPTGKFSALTALGNVCKEKLTMPTEFIGQNGAEIHETTNIGVTGCKKLTPAQVRAQKLKAALEACHKDKNKGKRQQCEKAARKRFGPIKKAKKGKGKK